MRFSNPPPRPLNVCARSTSLFLSLSLGEGEFNEKLSLLIADPSAHIIYAANGNSESKSRKRLRREPEEEERRGSLREREDLKLVNGPVYRRTTPRHARAASQSARECICALGLHILLRPQRAVARITGTGPGRTREDGRESSLTTFHRRGKRGGIATFREL